MGGERAGDFEKYSPTALSFFNLSVFTHDGRMLSNAATGEQKWTRSGGGAKNYVIRH